MAAASHTHSCACGTENSNRKDMKGADEDCVSSSRVTVAVSSQVDGCTDIHVTFAYRQMIDTSKQERERERERELWERAKGAGDGNGCGAHILMSCCFRMAT